MVGRTRQLAAQARPDDLPRGAHVADWTVVRTIAGGGFATVYEVSHRRDQRRAALKLLHAHHAASPDMRARFAREIRVVEQLRHPSIVELIDAGVTDLGLPYLSMELVGGVDLARFVAGGLGPAATNAILAPLTDALATAHAAGVVHRDIKPANVLVDSALDRVVLLDFGIAKLLDASPELTASHQALGTPACMAPEQIVGRPVDARTDIYALGVLAFFMLVGRMPFDDPSSTMVQYLHLHARRPRASAYVPVSPRVDDVIARAMALEPRDRFPDVQTFGAAMRAALRDTAATTRTAVEVPVAAVLVEAEPRGGEVDGHLASDLESVLPRAERVLASCGFEMLVDLGTSSIFVRPDGSRADAVAAALAIWNDLATRPHADARVRIAIAAHHGAAVCVGTVVHANDLARRATWQLPDLLDGVWLTGAIEPAAPGGRQIR